MNKLKQRRLAEKITRINKLDNQLYNKLGINISKYILDEIVDRGNKDNIIALIGLARINNRISEDDEEIFIKKIGNKIKKLKSLIIN